MSELKPCPFCGKSESVLAEPENPDEYGVLCNYCGSQGGLDENRDLAIKSWNTRPIESALRAELDEAKIPEEVRKALIYSVNYTISECVTNKRYIEALDWLNGRKPISSAPDNTPPLVTVLVPYEAKMPEDIEEIIVDALIFSRDSDNNYGYVPQEQFALDWLTEYRKKVEK